MLLLRLDRGVQHHDGVRVVTVFVVVHDEDEWSEDKPPVGRAGAQRGRVRGLAVGLEARVGRVADHHDRVLEAHDELVLEARDVVGEAGLRRGRGRGGLPLQLGGGELLLPRGQRLAIVGGRGKPERRPVAVLAGGRVCHGAGSERKRGCRTVADNEAGGGAYRSDQVEVKGDGHKGMKKVIWRDRWRRSRGRNGYRTRSALAVLLTDSDQIEMSFASTWLLRWLAAILQFLEIIRFQSFKISKSLHRSASVDKRHILQLPPYPAPRSYPYVAETPTKTRTRY